ncbi:MAG: serine/threonine-protein kinase, partial [bacterium]
MSGVFRAAVKRMDVLAQRVLTSQNPVLKAGDRLFTTLVGPQNPTDGNFAVDTGIAYGLQIPEIDVEAELAKGLIVHTEGMSPETVNPAIATEPPALAEEVVAEAPSKQAKMIKEALQLTGIQPRKLSVIPTLLQLSFTGAVVLFTAPIAISFAVGASIVSLLPAFTSLLIRRAGTKRLMQSTFKGWVGKAKLAAALGLTIGAAGTAGVLGAAISLPLGLAMSIIPVVFTGLVLWGSRRGRKNCYRYLADLTMSRTDELVELLKPYEAYVANRLVRNLFVYGHTKAAHRLDTALLGALVTTAEREKAEAILASISEDDYPRTIAGLNTASADLEILTAVTRKLSSDPEILIQEESDLLSALKATDEDDNTPALILAEVIIPAIQTDIGGENLVGQASSYRLGSEVGRGGMGSAWAATNTAEGREDEQVVIKFLPLEEIVREARENTETEDEARAIVVERVTRFQTEYATGTTLNHSACAATLDTNIRSLTSKLDDLDLDGIAQEKVFIVQEYVTKVEGDQDSGPALNLAQAFADGISRPQRLVELFIPMLEGLVHAHGKGKIHRDLKPQNILVQEDADGNLKLIIIDWGIAKDRADTSDLTSASMAVGSPRWMPLQEYLRNAKSDTATEADLARLDIYPVGLIMAWLLTGQLPEDLDSADIPEEIRKIVETAISSSPRDNYLSVADLITALESLSTRGRFDMPVADDDRDDDDVEQGESMSYDDDATPVRPVQPVGDDTGARAVAEHDEALGEEHRGGIPGEDRSGDLNIGDLSGAFNDMMTGPEDESQAVTNLTAAVA